MCSGQYLRFDYPHVEKQLANRFAVDFLCLVMLFDSLQSLVVNHSQGVQYFPNFFALERIYKATVAMHLGGFGKLALGSNHGPGNLFRPDRRGLFLRWMFFVIVTHGNPLLETCTNHRFEINLTFKACSCSDYTIRLDAATLHQNYFMT